METRLQQNKTTSTWRSIDWITIILYAIMVIAGWVSIYAASYNLGSDTTLTLSSRPVSQLFWMAASLLLIFFITMLDKNFFETFAFIIYAVVVIGLILTIFIAPNIKGSHSWLQITSTIRLQPAEFAKFATALALAKFMNTYDFKLLTPRNFITSAFIVLLPMLCIIMQKEAGTALVFVAFALVFYLEGMSGYVLLTSLSAVLFFIIELKYESVIWGMTPAGEIIVIGIILAVICVMLFFVFKERRLANVIMGIIIAVGLTAYLLSQFWPFNLTWVAIGLVISLSLFFVLYSLKKLVWRFILLALYALISTGLLYSIDYVFDDVLEPHQQQRIKVSLGLEEDKSGAGYNVNQSKIAIGSGGFAGKGFLNGTQTKLKYVPEQETDFIFCTVGEEFGFLGSLFVLLVYGIFLVRIIIVAERQDSTFGRVYGYSVASIFFFHVAVNIGMVSGITPVIGIPLPFFSYGGSSLLGFTILLFIFLRIDSGRKED
ncbi:MAG: rod shape-determining protein RodA [Tannerella sp.]|jgi:rod shape determining protein RodA|nr:rod shape-determining protein RodA [Tannerella sp.]